MDPDAALLEIREAYPFLEGWDPGEDVDSDSMIEAALSAIKNLDEWIQNGGFLPKAWQPKTIPTLEAVPCCANPVLADGPRIPARHGTFPTQVCGTCGKWRVHLSIGPAKWEPASTLHERIEDDDELS